jgi:hypothetical protein
MTTQSLAERLVFATETGESLLPPECAMVVLTSTLATPATFVMNHFLHQALKTRKQKPDEAAVYLSFLNRFDALASSMKKLVNVPREN